MLLTAILQAVPPPPLRRAEVEGCTRGLRKGCTEVELKRFSGHLSLRSLEVYNAHNREAAKRKARAWERHDNTVL
jgi:hypothetical protein